MKLDINEKQHVKYCVPLWQRDEQAGLATARIKARLEPHDLRPGESAAVVGYGPSLIETWETVRKFQYVFTCSGSHKFLLERGIVPTWHVEVDPRPHKVQLLGPPHKHVTYLAASCCHPKYFDHLEGYNVVLWHIFQNESEFLRVLPQGEWALTGGCDVGLRAMALARFLGFADLHMFGLDGCFGTTGRHAAEHPYGKQPQVEVEYGGRIYLTTPAMLEAARQTCHELNQLPDVQATFYGEGLTQALVRDRKKPEGGDVPLLAFGKPRLISAEYAQLNSQLHRDNLAFGVGGEKHAETVLKLCKTLKTKDVLDYGCGKGRLGKALQFHIQEYDPAVPGKEESPKSADIVVCTDVLEHVEPDRLSFVLDDLRRCVLQVGYFTIHTGPAQKTLPDGRNTHLIQQNKEWWEEKLRQHFTVGMMKQAGVELHCVVGPKRKAKKEAVAYA